MEVLKAILLHEPRGVLSLVGAGGKTSLLFNLARLLVLSGKTVLTTTTTKILVPTAEQSTSLLVVDDAAAVLHWAASSLGATGHVTAAAAQSAETGKLTGFAPEAIATFAGSGIFDWVLVEADGAARRPLKAPADHEPVVPPHSTVVIAVAGLEVIGSRFGEDMIFRSHLAGPIMELSAGEAVTEASLVRLLAHPGGSFRNAPAGARRVVFLNKADDAGRREAGARIAARLCALGAVDAVVVGQAMDGIKIHHCVAVPV